MPYHTETEFKNPHKRGNKSRYTKGYNRRRGSCGSGFSIGNSFNSRGCRFCGEFYHNCISKKFCTMKELQGQVKELNHLED
jgi:hypothetical protein